MGLDDAVTLALALQNPHVNIVAVIACEGAAGRERGTEHLERMLALFNRLDIPLYAPAETKASKTPPPFRSFAESAVGQALPTPVKPFRRPFSPDAYVGNGKKTVVLVLGPLTNLAAALQAKPEMKQGIEKLIVAGSPDVEKNWNVRFNPDALAAVQASGIPQQFVVRGPAGRKPEAWRQGELSIGQGTSVGEDFFKRLLATDNIRRHYTQQLGGFFDELVFLYYADHTLFSTEGYTNVFAPNDHDSLLKLFTRCLGDGRQHKHRVVFVDGSLPDEVFRPDVPFRRAAIIAKNGQAEWFAQLLMNELHEHLGAYSVIGVKMGLRAAELLNAPQHAMKVTSHAPAGPPVSCLNDGVIVATGCTPGRALFTHTPGPPGSIAVSFEYNGRRLTLAVKPEYRNRIKAEIQTLLGKYTLADHEYWDGVRRLGLDIWENWHRRDLFEIVDKAVAATA